VGGEPRGLADHGGVDVDDLEARVLKQAHGLSEEPLARDVLVLGVRGREVAADVPEGGRPDERVDYGVKEDVGVRVAGEPPGVWYLYPADQELAPVREGVYVVSEADSHNVDLSVYAAV